MNLQMNLGSAAGYKSASQVVRKLSESWAGENLYCAACNSDSIFAMPPNARAIDFSCQRCSATYQLKATKSLTWSRIPDGSYSAMMQALRSDQIPNLFVMKYNAEFCVSDLILIPSFFFSPSSIEMRKPLNPHARRAGWVGCNILLSKIASLGKIVLVTGYQSLDANKVRSWYQSLKPIRSIKTEVRGWTLDMLQIVRRINKQEFSLSDAYSFEKELSKCHPDNSNIRPKIRQQLQVLRNLGWLQFQGRGRYRLLLPEGSNASLDQKMPQF